MLYALGSVAIISLVSLVGAITLSLQTKTLGRVIFLGVSLSMGALFGDAFIHLIPEATAALGSTDTVAILVLAGIVAFFILEKFLDWQHSHETGGMNTERGAIRPVGTMVLLSDGIHNLIDGIIIGTSYLVSIEIGMATTLAIALHEIPQEIGNFGVLLHAGFTRARALFLNLISALTAIVGTALALALGNSFEYFVSVMLAITAGTFIYVAGSDLVPELRKTSGSKQSLLQLISILIGVALIFLIER